VKAGAPDPQFVWPGFRRSRFFLVPKAGVRESSGKLRRTRSRLAEKKMIEPDLDFGVRIPSHQPRKLQGEGKLFQPLHLKSIKPLENIGVGIASH